MEDTKRFDAGPLSSRGELSPPNTPLIEVLFVENPVLRCVRDFIIYYCVIGETARERIVLVASCTFWI